MARRNRKQPAGPCAPLIRAFPAIFLPCLVAVFRLHNGAVAAAPYLLLALALGGVISAVVPRGSVAALATLVGGGLLLTSSYLAEIQPDTLDPLPQAAEERQAAESSVQTGRPFEPQHLPQDTVQQPEAASASGDGAVEKLKARTQALAKGGDGRPPSKPAERSKDGKGKKGGLVQQGGDPKPPQSIEDGGFAQLHDHEADIGEPVPLESLSVVLPCAYEGAFASQTVKALLEHTKHHRLYEIIVVDDGSNPPLSKEFPTKLLRGSNSGPPVRIIRHEKTKGLIGAKKTGGDAARGDVIVFFDCHISPRDGWEEAFLKQMKRSGDHKTVVVPTITSLNPDTWQEIPHGPSSKACWLMLSGDFTWLANPGRDVPLMSGGLLAMSRRWWEETEGYDDKMVAWGGENLDQSLRTWLCGGRIEAAEGAFVAHMWRDPKNPKTTLKYPIPTRDVMRNKARAVSGWFGSFKDKTFLFPEYEDFITGKNHIGDMSNYDRLKKKLNCGTFEDYIRRFHYVYLDTGLIPREVFQVREEKSGLCLERVPNLQQPHSIVLAPCAGDGGDGGSTAETQMWHLGNRDHSKPKGECCSGLMNWNFVQCLDGGGVGSRLRTFECEISGHAPNQMWALKDDGQLTQGNGKACAAPEEPKLANGEPAAVNSCSSYADPVGDATVQAGGQSVPERFRLKSDQPGGNAACALVLASGDEWHLQFQKCDSTDNQQIFTVKPFLSGLLVKVGDTGMCLDAGGGAKVLVYPCYEASVGNLNQVWHLRNKHLVWENGNTGICVDFKSDKAAIKTMPVLGRYELKTCSSKPGQRLQKRSEKSDGSFEFYDPDANECLTSGGNAGVERSIRLGACGGGDARWKVLKDRDQVQHVASNTCVDAGDEVHPILYPCHQPRAGRKQKFEAIETPGWIQLMRGWEDNGRKRFFEKCFDRLPELSTEVGVLQCGMAARKGVKWSKYNVRVPPEWEAWSKAPSSGKQLGLPALPQVPP